ncbi:MAG: hypothetical protein Q8O67_00480 [Deltaproteobacteria bacterium]|nr:hypothetical protein [Deltaproteobacteria bacterium]
MTKIPPRDGNMYDAARKTIDNLQDKRVDKLRTTAKNLGEAAVEDLKGAGDHAVAGLEHGAAAIDKAAMAGVQALSATVNVAAGVADTLEAGVHLGKAAGFSLAGSAGFVVEGMAAGGRFVAKNVSEAFAALATFFSKALDGNTYTVRELKGDVDAIRFSKKMFGEAAKELNLSADSMNLAWASYVAAVGDLADGGKDAVKALGHTTAMLGHFAASGALQGLAAAEGLGAAIYEARAAGAWIIGEVAMGAITLTETANRDLRDLAVIGAKLSAMAANKLALPDQGKVVVTEGEQKLLKQLNDTMASLQKQGLTAK